LSVLSESGFSFDFSASPGGAVTHDRVSGDGNTMWPGVDFRVAEHDREIWIEIKSWSFKRILEKVERYKSNRDFKQKMIADEFRDEIFSKFLGTTSFLSWSGIGLPNSVTYVVFLEPPNRGSRALLQPFRDRLRDEFKNTRDLSWGSRIGLEVVDLEQFRAKLPNYPVGQT